MMFEIHKDAFYSRSDLQELLKPMGLDVDLFIGRLKARKVFRAVWKGSDILTAWEQAPALADHEADGPDMPKAKNKGNRRRRPGPRKGNVCGAKLAAQMEELKAQEREGARR